MTKMFGKIIYTILFLFLSVNISFAQFSSNQICLAGSQDDFLGTTVYNYSTNQNFSFKTKNGGSIYFGKSNSIDGTFSTNNGYYDIVIIKIGENGELEFTKNIGTAFSEHNFVVTQSNDSSNYFILTENYSNDSFYNEYFNGNITIQHSLKCINEHGNELWNKLLRVEEYNKTDSSYFPSPHYENQINLYTDKQDNNLTFFEKIKFDSISRQYIIDSIFYIQIDKNGNIKWINSTTPFSIYNNSKPELPIDTFFNYSFRTNNTFATTNSKYFTSANLSNNRNYSTALYSLDYNTGEISNVILLDNIYFNICSVKDNLLLYGSKSIYQYSTNSNYSSFLCQKYDENLNLVYENTIQYDDELTYTHRVSILPTPYFNSDSSKIWFDTYILEIDLDLYYGIIIGIHTKPFSYANIIDEQNGSLIKQVNLNKMEYTFISAKVNDVLYYLSTNLSQDSLPNSLINAYNFDGTTIHNKTFDSSFSVSNSQVFCNIPNSLALIYNSVDSLHNTKIGLIVLDTLCNLIMNATDNNFPLNYSIYKFHIIDTNRYTLISSIIQDTISSCYANSNNIILRVYSKSNLTSLSNHTKNDDKFQIFPNPNNGNFTVDFVSKGNYPITISLFDVTGKMVYQQNIQHNNQSLIQISDAVLAAGLYNIQISSANDIWNKKVMITK